LPNANTVLVRQRRTAAIPRVPATCVTCNGCNPNTVMSINWRASLVPAAAVIPAPRVYTNIAAVKTLVVGRWVQVCQVAGGPRSRRSLGAVRLGFAGTQPLVVCSCTPCSEDGENGSCSKSPSVGIDAVVRPTLVCLTVRGHRPARCYLPGPPPESTINVTVENSVCPKHPCGCMPVHGMSKHRPDVAYELCWPWCPFGGMRCWALVVPASPALRGAVVVGRPVAPVPVGHDGTARGEGYYSARGEILRPL